VNCARSGRRRTQDAVAHNGRGNGGDLQEKTHSASQGLSGAKGISEVQLREKKHQRCAQERAQNTESIRTSMRSRKAGQSIRNKRMLLGRRKPLHLKVQESEG